MEDLISLEEIRTLTNISPSQFKAFRRYGLVEGYAKKISVIKRDNEKTKEKGMESFLPAGFKYLYPRKVLSQISLILKEREKGKSLADIRNEFITREIQEKEELKRHVRQYEKIFKTPSGSSQDSGIREKLTGNAIRELVERIKEDIDDSNIKILVFVVEPEEHQTHSPFSQHMKARLDFENSQFSHPKGSSSIISKH